MFIKKSDYEELKRVINTHAGDIIELKTEIKLLNKQIFKLENPFKFKKGEIVKYKDYPYIISEMKWIKQKIFEFHPDSPTIDVKEYTIINQQTFDIIKTSEDNLTLWEEKQVETNRNSHKKNDSGTNKKTNTPVYKT